MLALIISCFKFFSYFRVNKKNKIKYVNDDIVVDDIPADFKQRQEDALLMTGVKKLTDTKGVDIPLSIEFFDTVDSRDIEALLFELVKVRAGQDEEKKD